MIKEITIKEIKPNPFKHFINEGKLDSERIAKMEESIAHGTLPETFSIRIKDGNNELCFGHHRLKAIANKKGNDYKVACSVVDYSDEQMLVDLVRENLTQRDTDYQDVEGSIVLTRSWLTTGAEDVKRFYNLMEQDKKVKGKKGMQGKRTDLGENHIDFRSIAKFLSKQGKTISHETVKNYLDIHDKLNPKLHSLVGKLEHATDTEIEGGLGIRTAVKLSRVNSNEQKPLFEQIKMARMNTADTEKAITAYKQTDDATKELVKEGKIKLADLIKQNQTTDDIEEEQIEKEISFEKRWEQDSKRYQIDLLNWRTVSLSSFTKAQLERYAKMIKDNQKEELKTFDYFLKKGG